MCRPCIENFQVDRRRSLLQLSYMSFPLLFPSLLFLLQFSRQLSFSLFLFPQFFLRRSLSFSKFCRQLFGHFGSLSCLRRFECRLRSCDASRSKMATCCSARLTCALARATAARACAARDSAILSSASRLSSQTLLSAQRIQIFC